MRAPGAPVPQERPNRALYSLFDATNVKRDGKRLAHALDSERRSRPTASRPRVPVVGVTPTRIAALRLGWPCCPFSGSRLTPRALRCRREHLGDNPRSQTRPRARRTAPSCPPARALAGDVRAPRLHDRLGVPAAGLCGPCVWNRDLGRGAHPRPNAFPSSRLRNLENAGEKAIVHPGSNARDGEAELWPLHHPEEPQSNVSHSREVLRCVL